MPQSETELGWDWDCHGFVAASTSTNLIYSNWPGWVLFPTAPHLS